MAGSVAAGNADMKTLYLVRHAKSSWADPSLADLVRPLNKRGRRDAPAMGQRLADKKIKVDAIWCSPALRAVETARLFAQALNIPKKITEQHERIYTSSIDDLLSEVTSCPDKHKTLLIVGHNPVLTEFANFLIDDTFVSEIISLPTSGIVALEFKCSSWQQIQGNAGRLLFFDYPKKDAIPE
jgi:phosphohistidine phosphatase